MLPLESRGREGLGEGLLNKGDDQVIFLQSVVIKQLYPLWECCPLCMYLYFNKNISSQ